MTRRRRSRSPWTRVGAAAALLVIGLAVGARVLDESLVGGDGSDARSSSYGDGATGVSAFAELLTRNGHPVERQRGDVGGADLDPQSTLFVLEPELLTPDESATILEFVATGGRLVIGGPAPEVYLGRIFDDPPTWSPDGPTRWTETSLGLTSIATEGAGSFDDPQDARGLVAQADDTLALEARRGDGTVVMLADVSALHNARLVDADNAAFGILLAGEDRRPVVFAEGVHGFGQASGLSAIPPRWRVAFAVGALAALAFVIARSRRLGPPVADTPAPPPARGEYVDSLAATLARSGDRRGAAVALGERMPSNAPGDPEHDPSAFDDASLVRVGRAHWRATTKEWE